MTTVADLKVKLEMESAKFRAEIDKAQQAIVGLRAELKRGADGVEKMGKKVETLTFLSVAREAVNAASALYGFVKAGADAADRMNDFADSIGLPADELARLSAAVTVSGGDADILAKGLTHLAEKMADAAGGGKEAAAVFDAMRISVKGADGQLRPVRDVLNDVADRFRSYKNGAAEAALATELLGKAAGIKLLPALNEGAAGLEDLAQRAAKAGLAMSEDVIRGAARFNDEVDKLKLRAEAAGASLAAKLAPALEQVNRFLSEGGEATEAQNRRLADSTKQWEAVAAAIGVAIKAAQDFSAFQLAGPEKLNNLGGLLPHGIIPSTADIQKGIEDAAKARRDALKKEFGSGKKLDLHLPSGPLGPLEGDSKSFADAFMSGDLFKSPPAGQLDAPIVQKAKQENTKLKAALEDLKSLSEQYRKLSLPDDLTEREKLEERLSGDERLKEELNLLRQNGLGKEVDKRIAKMREEADEADRASEVRKAVAKANAKAIDDEAAADARAADVRAESAQAFLDNLSPLERYREKIKAIEKAQRELTASGKPLSGEEVEGLKGQARREVGFDDELKAAQEEARTGAQRYAQEIQRIDDLEREFGKTAQDTALLRQKAWRQAFGDLSEFGQQGSALLGNVFDAFASNIQDGFGSAMKAVEQSFTQAVLRMLAQAAAANLSAALFGDKDSKGILSIAFAAVRGGLSGARAAGGPVGKARQYLVGEEGPELFVPDVSGRIVPADQTAAMMSGKGGGSQRVELVLPAQMVHMTVRDLIEKHFASTMAGR